MFRNMGAGTYRLRFEHPAFVTLEREVSMPASRALRTSAALNPAPSRPPSPKQDPTCHHFALTVDARAGTHVAVAITTEDQGTRASSRSTSAAT